MIREAIDFYHSLLNDQSALDTQSQLNSILRSQRLFFGDRPICTVLRPQFYEPDQWAYLKRETETLLLAFAKAHRAALADSVLRAQLHLEPYEEALFSLDIGYDAPWSTSRLDSFFDPDSGSLRFVEYNAETPAGMGYADLLSEAFLQLDVMKRFENDYALRTFTSMRGLMGVLLDIYKQWTGKDNPPRPRIGIIDWQDVPTLNEHHIIAEYLTGYGIESRLADPRALEYRNGQVWAGDFRVDLIYKRVLCSELIDRMGLENPIVHALRDKAVCMTNAFSAKLMAKKASFSLLSDERNAALFTDEERVAIEAHIPWTRNVAERKTIYHGKSIDLVPFIAENRDRLVLKPNDEYGGKGVTIGWETEAEEWNATLQRALIDPYVVQERVDAHFEDYPSVVNNKLDLSPRLVDADPYIYLGRTVNGCLTRLSSVTLLNVTAGGGSVAPTFIISKK